MSSKCANPYCNFQVAKMRSPTEGELHLWKSQTDQGVLDQFSKGKLTLMICQDCGIWTVEIRPEEQREIKRACIPSPFHYHVGERLRVTLEGKSFGMTGIVKQRKLLTKALHPPPVPENYYTIVLAVSQNEASFREDYLEPIE